MSTSNLKVVRPRNAKLYMQVCFAAKQPIFLWGPPGIGKSDIIASIADDYRAAGKRAHVVDMRLPLYEPTDIKGMPYFPQGDSNTAMLVSILSRYDNNEPVQVSEIQKLLVADTSSAKLRWAPSEELPDEQMSKENDHIILFLDEMNSAPPSVQAAAYQLVLNRRIGTYILPDNVSIVAAGNRETDKGVTYRMPKPLSNRFGHFEMAVNFEDWMEWAMDNWIDPTIIGYLNFKKENLFTFDPKSPDYAFPTPRSWAFVSKVLNSPEAATLTNPQITDIVCGLVGQGSGLQYMTHREIASKLPRVDDILAGKVKNMQTKEVSAMYSIITSITYELLVLADQLGEGVTKEMMDRSVNNAIAFFLEQCEDEMIIMAVRKIMKSKKIRIDRKTVTKYQDFYERFGDLVIAA